MKRIWLSIILLTVLLLTAAFQSYWIHNSFTEMSDLLDKSEWYVDAGEWDTAEDFVWEALTIWESKSHILSFLMREHELDEGGIMLERTAETLRVREREQYKIELAGLLAWMTRKAAGERLSPVNLM